MKKIIYAIIMFTMLLSATVAAADAKTTIQIEATVSQTDARAMFDIINKFRTSDDSWFYNQDDFQIFVKFDPLSYDYALEKVAMNRALELAVLYGHNRPNGTSYLTAFSEVNYMGYSVWESILAGPKTAEEAVKVWRADDKGYAGQGDRRNLLGLNYKAIGLAHVIVNGVDYWVAEFSTLVNTQNATPVVNKTYTVDIAVDPSIIKSVSFAVPDAEKLSKLHCGDTFAATDSKVKLILADASGNTSYGGGVAIDAAVKTEFSDNSIIGYDAETKSYKLIGAGKTTVTYSAYGKTESFEIVSEHKADKIVGAVEATCTEAGNTGDIYCSGCNTLVTEKTAIEAKGHTLSEPTEAVEATCTEEGYTSGVVCTVCGEVIQEMGVVPAKGHTPGEPEEKVEATCTEDGYTSEVACTVCGEIVQEKGVIPAKGHTPGEPSESVEATCTTDGYSGEVVCTECGVVIYEKVIIPAAGHVEVKDKKVDATYTKTGLTAGSHCSVCGEIIKAQTVIDKLVLKAPVLSSAANTASGVKLTWEKVSGAKGYYVYRNSKLIGTVTKSSTVTYTDKTASNGTKYTYTVKAYVGEVKSKASEKKIIYRISAPTISSAKNNSVLKLKAAWNKNSKVTGYQVKIVNGSNSKIVVVAGAKNVNTIIDSLKKNKTYKVYVRGYIKKSGVLYVSAWSSAKSVKITK